MTSRQKWYEKNKERILAKLKVRYELKKDELRRYGREHNRKNRERRKITSKAYSEKHKEQIRLKSRNWYIKNKTKALAACKKRREKYKEELSEYHKEYRTKNLGKTNAIKKKYKLAKKKACPKWLTKQQLKEIEYFYIEAQRLTLATGILHHVDHIMPLQGKNSCGLHVPWNLQILKYKENISKGNKIL